MTDDSATPAQRRLTLAALALAVLLSALDQTIVATAMPRIVEQLRGLSAYAWVTTAYLLTSTVSVPIYGKLSDQHGRKPILLAGVLVFLAGSALCGLAGEFGNLPLLGGGMTQLIVFRAVQGLGAGALLTVSFAVVADLYPPRERGRLFGVFGSMFALASVIGPFIGGLLTDHATSTLFGREVAGWRWVFYVNLPLGLLALFMIVYRMPVLRRGTGGRIDYPGAALIIVSTSAALLALTLGGTTYPWGSPGIVGLFAIAALTLAGLVWVERRTQDAILPLPVFRVHAFRMAAMGSFVMSMAFLGIVMFMPLYMQAVQGISATQSGVALLPAMIGMSISSILSGRLVSRTGRYKPFMIGGTVVLFVGVVFLTAIGPDTSPVDLAWRLALMGIGLGPAQTLFGLVMQNAAPAEHLGVATSIGQFSRQIGSTVGVAVLGTFLTHSLMAGLPKHVPLLPGASEHRIDLAHAQTQAMDIEAIRQRVTRALDERFDIVARAYQEDEASAAEVLADPRLPEQIKAPLREGGIRGRIHRQLVELSDTVAMELEAGTAGRDRLLLNAELPAGVRQQLANIPPRALQDAQLSGGIAQLFRDALLAKEDALVTASARQSTAVARQAMNAYAVQLIDQTQQGMRIAFTAAITHLLERALWIIGAGLVLVLFIPEIPLRSRAQGVDQPQVRADA